MPAISTDLFVLSDFIDSHPQRALILQNLSTNVVLPTHQDNENDSLHTLMSILLQTPSVEARKEYILAALNSISTLNNSALGRILRDEKLFAELFKLFQMEHFRSCDNLRAGLSIRNIATWYSVIGGVSKTVL